MTRERHVSDIIREAFRRSGIVRGVARAEAVLLWPHIVGAEVARFATAVALRDGTLIVDVPDPETALHLGMQRHHVLAAYSDRLGAGAVREVRFRVGRPPAAPPPPPAPEPAEVDPEALAQLARGLPDLDDTLASTALRAGRSLLELRARRLAAGWRPCPVCGSLREGAVAPPTGTAAELDPATWCPTCARHATATKVERAAMRLLAAPEHPCPELTFDEREVALRLARRRGVAAADALLPYVLAQPDRAPELARLALVLAALHHGVSTSDVDDERLAQAVDRRILRALPPHTLPEESS
jgi:hypothetical protein